MGSWRGDRAIFWGQSLLLWLLFYAPGAGRAVISVTYASDLLGPGHRDHRHRNAVHRTLSLSSDIESHTPIHSRIR